MNISHPQDDQVDMHGTRIELGEIEAALRRHPGVDEAIVMAHAPATGEQRLMAYLVPDPQTALPLLQLLRFQRTGRMPLQQQYQLPNGMTIACRNKAEPALLYREVFEEQTYVKHGVSIEDGDCIVDVGANIGIFTLFAAQQQKNIKIYAFEPIPAIFELLSLNAELYRLDAKLFACGLSKETRSETFTYYPYMSAFSGCYADVEEEKEFIKICKHNAQGAGKQAFSSNELDAFLTESLKGEHITCPVKTLSEVMHEQSIGCIDLLKIDVEKSELDVLEGIEEEDWQKIKQIVIEVHDIDDRVKKVTQLLKRHGYEVLVEQDRHLRGTKLYNIYAIHPSRKSQSLPPAGEEGTKSEATERGQPSSYWASVKTLIDDVQNFLKKALPDSMLPASIVLLEELDEIEAVLRRHPGVDEAIVMAHALATGEQCLMAYLVPDPQTAFPLLQLLRFQRTGRMPLQQQYQLPNGMTIVSGSKNEPVFSYREVFEEQTYIKHGISIEDGDCIVDVGANIGIFTLFAAQQQKNIKIYAFEPIPAIFELLSLNAELYQLDAKLFACGLSKEARNDTFTYYPAASLASGRYADMEEEKEIIKTYKLNEQGAENQALSNDELDALLTKNLKGEHITCPVKTLSEVICEESIECIDLLKIDVEKSELDVLEGIEEEDWQKIKQIVIEVHDIDNRVKKMTQLLKRHGYEVLIEQDRLFRGTNVYNIYAIHPSRKSQSVPPAGEDGTKSEATDRGNPSPYWASVETLISDVQNFLKKALPDYMLPASIVLLEELPLAPNGKADRHALSALAASARL